MAREYFEGEADMSDMKCREMQQMFHKTLVEDERQRLNKSSEIPPPPPKEDAVAAIAQQLQKNNQLLVDQLR